jgi:NIPSNAP
MGRPAHEAGPVRRLIEIRSYILKPGAAAEFHAAVTSNAVPMLRDWGTDVVAFGPSAHAPDTYFLIRAYTDLDDLNRRQEAFYGSDEWRNGPRESIVSRIESFLSTVLWLSPEAVEDLRRHNTT